LDDFQKNVSARILGLEQHIFFLEAQRGGGGVHSQGVGAPPGQCMPPPLPLGHTQPKGRETPQIPGVAVVATAGGPRLPGTAVVAVPGGPRTTAPTLHLFADQSILGLGSCDLGLGSCDLGLGSENVFPKGNTFPPSGLLVPEGGGVVGGAFPTSGLLVPEGGERLEVAIWKFCPRWRFCKVWRYHKVWYPPLAFLKIMYPPRMYPPHTFSP
jgi:hypothetical protein